MNAGIITLLESTTVLQAGLIGTFTNYPLGFITNQNGSTTPSMWITSTGTTAPGNVGILTSSPAVPLEVNGVAAFDSAVGIGTTSPVAGNGLTIAPAVSTSGSPSVLTVNGPADTGLTAAEANDINLNLARTVTFGGGFSTQRAILAQAPTYAFSPASTLSTAATLDVTGPPAAGSGATITSSYGLRVESPTTPLTTSVNSAYGLSVAAPSGASNNYAALFAGPVSGAVGNPSGVLPANGSTYPGTVYHMDGVKYTSLNQLIAGLPSSMSAVTIYDDCPGGAETITTDPFHTPGAPANLKLQIISAPCLYTFIAPPVLDAGDQWIGAAGGYNQTQQQNPTVAGTVFKMGPDMNGQITTLPSPPPTASYVSNPINGGTDSNCPVTTALVGTHYYYVGLSATNAVGETPLLNGNHVSSSWTLPGNSSNPGSNYCIKFSTGTVPSGQGVGIYLLDGGTSSMFPAKTDSAFEYYKSIGGVYYISSLGAGNPPPDVNTTQFLAGIGTCKNGGGNIITHAYYRGITFDVSGGAIGVANCDGQDPPSGIEDDTFLNCLGDSCYLAEGYDGNLGANGSSVRNIFIIPSNCGANPVPGAPYTGAIGGGCAGGIDNGPTGTGTIAITGGTNVTGSGGASFATDGSLNNAIISIAGSVSNCVSAPAPCEIASVGSGGTTLTLASAYTGSCSTGCTYAIAGSTDQNYTTWPTYGVHLDRVAQFKSLINFDFGGDNCGNSSTSTACNVKAAVKADGSASMPYASKAEIFDVHEEGTAAGGETIPAGVEINGMPAFVCGIHTSAQVTYSVQLDAGSVADTLCDLVPYNGTLIQQTAVNDLVNVRSSTAGNQVGFYAIGTTTGNYMGSDTVTPVSVGGNGIGAPTRNHQFHDCPTTGACSYLPSVRPVLITTNTTPTASTSGQDIGWDWNLDPSAAYRVSCQVIYTTSGSTAGFWVSATDNNQTSDTLSLMNFEQISATQIHSNATTALGTLAGVAASASSFFANVNGFIQTDSSPGGHTFKVLVASNSTTQTVTVAAGSWCTVQ